MKTFNIEQTAEFLSVHRETVRRLAATGKIPGVKIGKRWIFIEQDLALYIRSQYSDGVTSQGAVNRSTQQWRFIKEMKLGGSASLTMDKEYNEALGLVIK